MRLLSSSSLFCTILDEQILVISRKGDKKRISFARDSSAVRSARSFALNPFFEIWDPRKGSINTRATIFEIANRFHPQSVSRFRGGLPRVEIGRFGIGTNLGSNLDIIPWKRIYVVLDPLHRPRILFLGPSFLHAGQKYEYGAREGRGGRDRIEIRIRGSEVSIIDYVAGSQVRGPSSACGLINPWNDTR